MKMKTLKFSLILSLLLTVSYIFATETPDAHNKKTGNVTGEVIDENGEHLPFASVSVVGTTMGVATDDTGHYLLKFIPTGMVTLEVQYLGFKPQQKQVEVKALQTAQVNFQLEKDALGLEEIVVTGDRTAKDRKSVSIIVNTISPQIFKMTQSATFGEGLNFTPGVRMEDNCQNCGFSQVRMNGMEGPYSQILINSRPIFSGLAGVYGLELIPSNMIDRVEVVRGGGSALYGSNAIAGTINMILKDPIANTYEAGFSSAFTGLGVKDRGAITPDHNAHINTSIVSDNNKTGLALYGFWRDRKAFDANNDSFSELANIENTTVGARIFHRLGSRNKITADLFNIRENRRGGNKFDYVEHESDIAESLRHSILTGALSYDQFFREKDLWSVYVSGQKVNRNSYYGAEQSLSDYGTTNDLTYTIGTQYNAYFENAGNLTVGAELISGALEDTKLGYFDVESNSHTSNVVIADQESNTVGAFAQYEIKFNELTASIGARYDHYSVKDNLGVAKEKTGDVFSPRVTLKYDIADFLQARASYSQGYRAPQIFDEDLHIETSGAKQIIHKNDPNLKQETSYSWMGSLDFNKRIGSTFVNFLIEGFYTKLDDAFANEIGDPVNGVVTFTRVNAAKGADIKGVNMELNIIPSENFSFQGGFTLQKSAYKEAQDYENTNFLRTPDTYGYFSINTTPAHDFGIALTGTYTGQMDVPYEGGLAFRNAAEKTLFESHQDADGEGGWVVRKSDTFFDLGLKLHYDLHVGSSKLRLFTGMKNIFNSYQDDFDSGVNRDPAYIYGPMNPRTVYFGITLGNNLK